MATQGQAFGIDIGGSGVKGAPVDLEHGALTTDRFRIPTPQPSTPDAVAEVVRKVCEHFAWQGAVGVTFPGVVLHGVARTAANVHKSWVGTDLAVLFGAATGQPVVAVNDADAAGVAEARFGAAKDRAGVVILATLGTGIGSALLVDGRLVPNTELGHLEVDGHEAEKRASDAARERDDLGWKSWSKRVERYLRVVEDLFWPDLIVVGGGVSKEAKHWLHYLDLRTEVVPAALLNTAGIVGAALLAAESDAQSRHG